MVSGWRRIIAKTAWVCEKCGSSFNQLEKAESCEDNHISIDQLKINENTLRK